MTEQGMSAIKHYVAMRDAQPLKGLDDSIHCIHTGTEFAAELRLADVRKAVNSHDALVTALEEISADIKPELCASELELIVWWGRQVDRLQAIARDALDAVGQPTERG